MISESFKIELISFKNLLKRLFYPSNDNDVASMNENRNYISLNLEF